MYLFENILPKDIIKKIYQYDPTYHEQQKKVFIEIEQKLKFWRIKWLNGTYAYGAFETQNQYNISDFQNSIKNTKYLSDYWNYVYPQHYAAQRKNNHTIKGSKNCEFEYINDSIKANKHIFGRLKMLKKYTISDKNQLYKPGKFYQTSPF